ncbi:MAG: polymer-forming cytoskeletal protein, partial [Prolixibacteraceae bacterium]|nr:polymer-forming cytoskeletal protein [Prolixibacteraceae bacterium]
MAKQAENNMGAVNLIAATTKLVGDINTESDIRIDGKLHGNLITKGRLVIGKSGTIKGEITCKEADIEGMLDGKINVQELLSIKSSATLNGEVFTKQLMI